MQDALKGTTMVPTMLSRAQVRALVSMYNDGVGTHDIDDAKPARIRERGVALAGIVRLLNAAGAKYQMRGGYIATED
jgi:hypothetical protein